MHSFKDTEGKQWDVRLTLGFTDWLSSKRTQDDLVSEGIIEKPFSFYDVNEDFSQILINGHLQMFMIYALVEPQVEKRGITMEDWKNRMDSTTLQDAKEALRNEILDFFPEKKTLLQKVTETISRAEEKIGIAIENKILQEGLPGIENEINRVIEEINSTDMNQLGALLEGTGENSL